MAASNEEACWQDLMTEFPLELSAQPWYPDLIIPYGLLLDFLVTIIVFIIITIIIIYKYM